MSHLTVRGQLDGYAVSGSSPPAGAARQERTAVMALPRLSFTPEEAAQVLGVSRSFFYEQILGELMTVRVGRKRLVPLGELERFLTSHAARALP